MYIKYGKNNDECEAKLLINRQQQDPCNKLWSTDTDIKVHSRYPKHGQAIHIYKMMGKSSHPLCQPNACPFKDNHKFLRAMQ